MSDLNQEQQQAIDAISNGSVAVIAGPGSGKTHTLVEAIRAVLQDGAQPKEVLCLTFTKKAAESLGSRLGVKNVFTGTFHALAITLMDEKSREKHIVGNGEQQQLIAQLKLSRDLKGVNSRELSLMISRAKNGAEVSEQAAQLRAAYDELLDENGWLDYDDMITLASVKATAGNYSHIFVDEFQDTSPAQYELLKKLAGKDTKLFVIGDPKQSIYRFRGADGSIFELFTDVFTPYIVHLTANYRSAKTLVDVTNRIFAENPQKAVQNEVGEVRQIETLDEYTEADYVRRAIEKRLGGSDWQHTGAGHGEADLGEFAVLYRTRRQGRLVAEKLRDSGLPVQCLGEESPFAAPVILLLMSILGYVETPIPESWEAVERAAKLAKCKPHKALVDTIEKAHTLPELVRAAAVTLNKQDEASVLQLENIAIRFASREALKNHLEDLSTQEYFDPTAAAIVLSTIHASKGLEFERVFVIGCNQGVLPSARAGIEDLDEEKRLFYVAASRARQELTLTYTQKRNKQPAQISPFLTDLHLKSEFDGELESIKAKRRKYAQKRAQQQLF